jgi:alpha-mannosidase
MQTLSRTAILALPVFVIVSLLPCGGIAGGDAMNKTESFLFVPHTHWEGAVFKTREDYLEVGLQNILKALGMLKAHPDYRFTLDQACYVSPFLERYPEQEELFRKLVAEGRLELVGGTDVMADVNMPCGESFVRQILYGKRYFWDKLGVDVTVGWQLDTFGHHAQMPQLLKLGGFESFWFFRGVPNWDVPSEFLWEGLDGSRIPAFWLPQGYALLYGAPKTFPEFAEFIRERFHTLDRQARGPDRVGLAGADVTEPETHVRGLLKEFNLAEDKPFHLRFAVPTEFEKAVADRKDRPVLRGELNPIFQGTYSSRIELKQKQRELERLLTSAEKLAAVQQWLGSPADTEALWRAWEPVLFNQAHDLASGVMTDQVYEDSQASYRHSQRLVDEILDTGFEEVHSRIDTQGEGFPVVVWNLLGWPRTDVAQVEVGLSDRDTAGLTVVDDTGQEVPSQIVSAETYPEGGLLRAKIAFLAHDVPPVGYAVYHVLPQPSAGGFAAAMGTEQDEPVLENEHVRVRLDPSTGAMSGLVLKSASREMLSRPGNVVSREHDAGDLWELYKPLDGGSRIAMTDKQPVPQAGKATFSSEFGGEPGKAVAGPVFSEFEVNHPFDSGNIATRVRLYSGLERVEIRTSILNNEKFVRYQVLFPTSLAGGRAFHEIPFGAIERPQGIEFPAQNWVDTGDGAFGLALLNRGLPGNVVSEDTMMLSLMRSTRIVAYGFGGGYEPGMSSDSGFELGKEIAFDYALVPHTGDWRQAKVYRHGLEFNHPLLARKSTSHPGELPKRWGFLKLDPTHPGVVLSALKPGPDGSTILRVYEAAGTPAPGVKIIPAANVLSCEETNLMEDSGAALDLRDNTVQFDLRAFEIKTIRFQLE